MSTRSQVQFGYVDQGGFQRSAMIYHHFDGYPSGRLPNILSAINTAHQSYNNNAGYSYRIQSTYPTDLAAFYILTHKQGAGNVEIDEHYHGDIEYLYQVWQDEVNKKFYVKILVPAENFWDEPRIENTTEFDMGELSELIEKYKEV